MNNQSTLKSLMHLSTVVVDSANFSEINRFHPIDATTNPSSVLAAIRTDGQSIKSLLDSKEIQSITEQASNQEQAIEIIYDHLLVALAAKILDKIEGLVSIEVDAEFAYDDQATLKRARALIAIAKEKKLDYQRILIKVASTWQGIVAAQSLEKEGVCCNLTLIFNYYQALACAKIGAHTISPFVGRVLDWYKNNHPNQDFSDPEKEPGVQLVRSIYQSFKRENLATIVMGASFRNSGEIIALAGCDKLTIHPQFLAELDQSNQKLIPNINQDQQRYQLIEIDEQIFNAKINQDAMAKELLAAGVAGFAKDTRALKTMIAQLIA